MAEQRDTIYNAFGLSANNVDTCIVSPSRSGIYLTLHSLLKNINFDILNIVGYETDRTLVLKIFMPVQLGIFISNGGLGDAFSNRALTLSLSSKKAGRATVRSVFERRTMRATSNYSMKNTATV